MFRWTKQSEMWLIRMLHIYYQLPSESNIAPGLDSEKEVFHYKLHENS